MEPRSSFLASIFSYTLPSWLCWTIFSILMVILVYILKDNKEDETDVHIRALQRFQFTHKEVLPLLSKKERHEMLQVLENTIANARLFKDKKELVKLDTMTKKKLNKEGKRVCFKV